MSTLIVHVLYTGKYSSLSYFRLHHPYCQLANFYQHSNVFLFPIILNRNTFWANFRRSKEVQRYESEITPGENNLAYSCSVTAINKKLTVNNSAMLFDVKYSVKCKVVKNFYCSHCCLINYCLHNSHIRIKIYKYVLNIHNISQTCAVVNT